jgi:DNA gyrase subunit A
MANHPGTIIIDTPVDEEMKTSFLAYSMSVVVSRALPDVRDGLKPVHRRLLYGMNEQNLLPSRPHVKCANAVGHCMGRYHPHGDSAIYEALVRLAQDFSMRVPLLDGHGNFGGISDPPAAMRYCSVGETLVRTPSGTVRLDSFVPDAAPNTTTPIDAKVLDKFGNPVTATAFHHSGVHPVLRLVTKEGFTTTATTNHPLLCLVNVAGVPVLLWKRLDEIQAGDRVAISRTPAAESGHVLTQREADLALLFGSFISEGWYGNGRAGFNNTDADWFTDVEGAYARVVGGKFYSYSRDLPSGKALYELDVQNVTSLDATELAQLAGARSADKRIPDWVWTAPAAAKARFLQAAFEGDGSVSVLARNSICLTYSTRSAQLARDIQLLLLEFGIVARRYHRQATGEHVVRLGNRRQVELFAGRVGFYSTKQDKLAELLITTPAPARDGDGDTIPHLAAYLRAEAGRGRREWLAKHNLAGVGAWERDGDAILSAINNPEAEAVARQLVEAGYFYATVKMVEPAGERAVYSLKVDSEDHSYLADGFVNHNTEVRLAPTAVLMTQELDEDTVDFTDNFDGSYKEPKVLPAALPNLIVNGTEGIAVGMTTKLAPHNLNEAIAACTHLLRNPDATDEDIIQLIPGPDLPTGGTVHNLDGVREYLTTGKGTFKMRATAKIEDVSARRKGIVVTELPYQVGPEKVIEDIKKARESKRLQGVSNVVDLSDMKSGLRLVIECKTGFNPQAVLADLYKLTALETSFTVHQLALVDGFPRTLTMRELVAHYVAHRDQVTTRRCTFRRNKAQAQAHLLEGYLIALANIEEVVKIIRGSADTAAARATLMANFALSEVQTNAILEMPLRRLTNLEVSKIEKELAELNAQIAELTHYLTDRDAMVELICAELEDVARRFGTPRRTRLVDTLPETTTAAPLEVPDEPTVVTLSTTGLLGRFGTEPFKGTRGRHDALTATLTTTARATIGAVTTLGRLHHVNVLELPQAEGKNRGGAVGEYVPLENGEKVLALVPLDTDGPMLALGTRAGLVKRLAAKDLPKKSGQEIIGLKDADTLIGVAVLPADPDAADLVFVTSDAQLLRTAAAAVRPQGRTGGGVAGIRLGEGAHLVTFTAVPTDKVDDTAVVTVSDRAGVKTTPLSDYPAKGRGTGGVRCMRFAKGETALAAAAVTHAPLTLVAATGSLVKAPAETGRRDGAGTRLDTPIAAVALTR